MSVFQICNISSLYTINMGRFAGLNLVVSKSTMKVFTMNVYIYIGAFNNGVV